MKFEIGTVRNFTSFVKKTNKFKLKLRARISLYSLLLLLYSIDYIDITYHPISLNHKRELIPVYSALKKIRTFERISCPIVLGGDTYFPLISSTASTSNIS